MINIRIRKVVIFASLIMIMLSIFSVTCFAEKGKTEKPKKAYSSYIRVKKVTYDPDKKSVTFTFKDKVNYKKVQVKIKDLYGWNYGIKVKSKKSKKLVEKVKKLKYGYVYYYSISGIRRAGTKKYITISGLFRAIN